MNKPKKRRLASPEIPESLYQRKNAPLLQLNGIEGRVIVVLFEAFVTHLESLESPREIDGTLGAFLRREKDLRDLENLEELLG